MIENTFIKKIASGILRDHKLTIVERNIMHPERDWLLGIFVGTVVVTIAAIWSVNIYLQFKNISVVSSAESPESVIYKENLVNIALTDFSKRKDLYQSLKQELLNMKQAATVVVPPVEIPTMDATAVVDDVTATSTSTSTETKPIVEMETVGEVIKME